MSDRVVRPFVLMLVLLVPAVPALAGFGATESYLLSVGQGAGSAGSHWYTTVWISNPTDNPAQLRIEFLERGTSNPSPATFTDVVPPGETICVDDAVETLFALTDRFGAFRIVSDREIIVTSRIYSEPSGGGVGDSVGQLFTAVPAELAIGAGESTDLLGVFQTSPQAQSELRYNFGFVETAGGNATVRVSAYDGYDPTTSLGSKDYTVGPYGAIQHNISHLLPSPQADNVRLAVEVLSGSSGKVAAFGSGLANRSNDPSTFEMSFDPSLLGNGGSGGDGLEQVHHDATLAGEGTSSSPLGVADGGINNAQLADDAVGSAKIFDGTVGPDDLADGAVRKGNIAASGGTAGDVLAWDGSALQWQAPGGGLVLPYDGSVSSSSNPAFSISNNCGLGCTAICADVDDGTAIWADVVDGVTISAAVYTGIGVKAVAWHDGIGVMGGSGGYADTVVSAISAGVLGSAVSNGVSGVYGHSLSGDGVIGLSEDANRSGVYARNDGGGWAGFFHGNATVTGSLTKGGGAFKIDHPLDPENQYLYHSFVESPDMMNVYNGNVVLDEHGEAWVELPDWFEALNRDFRYQLTCIGGFAPVYVAREITGNRFEIAGGSPGMKVSWQVTGIRQDPWAEANRIPVEEPKVGVERGTYVHPRAYGRDEGLTPAWVHRPEAWAEERAIRAKDPERYRHAPLRSHRDGSGGE